jgi:hypothetical protein
MTDKLNLYDLLGSLVPETLLIAAAAILFPALSPAIAVSLPSEFVVFALLAVALVAGLVLQTLGSALEPLLFMAFGGRPSDLALTGTLGERYLPADAATRIVFFRQACVTQADHDGYVRGRGGRPWEEDKEPLRRI